MSSIIEQRENEWLNFLSYLEFNNINVTDNQISSYYMPEFNFFITKKARKYIKVNSSRLLQVQVSKTYANWFGNTERDKLDIKVQTLVNQFFTWKKEKDLLDANENKLSFIFTVILIKIEQEIVKNKNIPRYRQNFIALKKKLLDLLNLDFRDLDKTQSIKDQLNIQYAKLKYLQKLYKIH